MAQLSIFRSLKAFFTTNLHSSEFTYVLWPFVRLCKFSGFAPIKFVVNDGATTRQRCEKIEWDVMACVLTAIGAIVYIVGFITGVHHLSHSHNWTKLYEASAISFFTSWAQILTLFLLGAMAVITAWTHMSHLRRLSALIYKIDDGFRTVPDILIDYTKLRTKLYFQFVVFMLVPIFSSMVNCVIIEKTAVSITWVSSCFWFICFMPIMLVTFKEFQFYSLLFILKSKFQLVNQKLKYFSCTAYRTKMMQQRMRRMISTSEIPLTSVVSNAVEHLDQVTEELNLETLQKLFEIYSLTADAVELTLRIFAWHLLLLTSTSVFVITIQSYNLFMLIAHSMTMEPFQIFFIVLWIIVQIFAVGINVSACSMTSKTMSKTGPLLHKIRVPHSECGMAFYQVLQLFSLEVLQRKNNFTASGFFDINYKLITSIIAAVTTYLVIIIQFHLTNIPERHFHQPPL